MIDRRLVRRLVRRLLPALCCVLFALPTARAAESLESIFQNLPGAESEQDIWGHLTAGGRTATPKHESVKNEYVEFEGYYVPNAKTSRLWVLADEGVDVWVVDYGLGHPAYSLVWPGQRHQRHEPPLRGRLKLREIRYPFRVGEPFRLRVEYANIEAREAGDPDGCTLIASDGGGRIVGTLALEVASGATQVGNPLTATAILTRIDGTPGADEDVHFMVDAETFATVRTDADGMATAEYTPHEPGTFRIRAASQSPRFGFLKSRLVSAIGPGGLSANKEPSTKPIRSKPTLGAEAQAASETRDATAATAAFGLHAPDEEAVFAYLREKNGQDVPAAEVPDDQLTTNYWYEIENEYLNSKGTPANLYRQTAGHLQLAARLLANKDRARRRLGLGIAHRAAGNAATRLEDFELATMICETFIIPNLDAADANPCGELSWNLLLGTVAEIYNGAGAQEKQLAALRLLHMDAPNARAVEAVQRKLDAAEARALARMSLAVPTGNLKERRR